MKKRILSLALALFCTLNVICGMSSSVSAADYGMGFGVCGAEGDNISWKLEEFPEGQYFTDVVLKITGEGEMADYDLSGENPSPWAEYWADTGSIVKIVISEGITGIGDFAFYQFKRLTEVEIPSTLTRIGDYAFYSTDINGICLPEGLSVIGNHSFESCTYLSDLTLPDGLLSIGESTFRSCHSLINVEIPEGVVLIGYGAFSDCMNLETVKIPSSVTDIVSQPFGGSSSLKNIEVSAENPVYKSVDGVLYTKEGTVIIKYPACKSDTEYTIPDGVVDIEENAFDFCVNLVNVTIPSSVRNIGDSAFGGSGIVNAFIPDGVVNIGSYAFSSGHLETVVIPTSVKSIGYGAFYSMFSNLQTVYYMGSEEQWNNIEFDILGINFDRVELVFNFKPGGDSILGDVDGDGVVSIKDIMDFKLIISGAEGSGTIDSSVLDVNGDGKVNAQDYMMLKVLAAV